MHFGNSNGIEYAYTFPLSTPPSALALPAAPTLSIPARSTHFTMAGYTRQFIAEGRFTHMNGSASYDLNLLRHSWIPNKLPEHLKDRRNRSGNAPPRSILLNN